MLIDGIDTVMYTLHFTFPCIKFSSSILAFGVKVKWPVVLGLCKEYLWESASTLKGFG